VFSVTSEAAASVAFQTAPPKPARPGQSPQADSFGALVDSNAPPDTSNDRAVPPAQPQSASPRRADDAANADNSRSRDTGSADRAAKNASDDRDAAANQANAAADASANAETVQRPGAKSGAAKAGSGKTTEKPSSDAATAADQAASASPGAPPLTPPVAVAIAVPVISTDVPAATPTSGNATASGIAAGAIAASAPPPSTAKAPPALIKIDSDAATIATAAAPATASVDDTASATTTANTSATTTTAKIAVQAAAGESINAPVKPPTAQTDSAAPTNGALTTAVVATAGVLPKATPLKAPLAAPAKAAASAGADTGPGASDASATAAPAEAARGAPGQQPAVTSRPEAGNDLVDTTKADASASSASAATPPVHDHSQAAATGHLLTDSSETGAQATGTIQPQLPAAAAATAPVGPLSVTAATNAPVPLGGLALEIVASARSGKSRFDIRLDPADLGRIDVRIDVDRNGQVTSHLTVEKPETLSLLRQDAPQLQRALDDAGVKTGDGGLQFSLRDQSSSGRNNDNETGRNAQRLVIGDEDTIPAAIAGRTYGRVLGSSSGVDIRV